MFPAPGLDSAIKRAEIEVPEGEPLSWHSLRHSAGSIWLVELRLALPTVSEMLGHSSSDFTLKCYIKEPRDHATVVADVLAKSEVVGVGA